LEDHVFGSKSRTEQLQDHSASLASSAGAVADQLRDRVAPAVGQAAGSALEWGQPRVEAAREWAKPRVEHGIEVAAPRLESAVSSLAPRVDTARDKIVDELLPRVTEAIAAFAAASAAAKDEAVARGSGVAAVASGNAVATRKRKKKGKVFLFLGLLAAAAAGAAAFMKKGAPKDDPWATPLSDPWTTPAADSSVPASSGKHSSVSSVEAAGAADDAAQTDTKDETPSVDALIEDLDETDVPDPLEPKNP